MTRPSRCARTDAHRGEDRRRARRARRDRCARRRRASACRPPPSRPPRPPRSSSRPPRAPSAPPSAPRPAIRRSRAQRTARTPIVDSDPTTGRAAAEAQEPAAGRVAASLVLGVIGGAGYGVYYDATRTTRRRSRARAEASATSSSKRRTSDEAQAARARSPIRARSTSTPHGAGIWLQARPHAARHADRAARVAAAARPRARCTTATSRPKRRSTARTGPARRQVAEGEARRHAKPAKAGKEPPALPLQPTTPVLGTTGVVGAGHGPHRLDADATPRSGCSSARTTAQLQRAVGGPRLRGRGRQAGLQDPATSCSRPTTGATAAIRRCRSTRRRRSPCSRRPSSSSRIPTRKPSRRGSRWRPRARCTCAARPGSRSRSFTTRKLRKGKLLSMKVPFVGEARRAGHARPRAAERARDRDRRHRAASRVAGRGRSDSARGSRSSSPASPTRCIARIKRAGEPAATMPATDPPIAARRAAAHVARDARRSARSCPPTSAQLFQHLTGELRRLRSAAVHEVLGVARDADPEQMRARLEGRSCAGITPTSSRAATRRRSRTSPRS